MSTRLKHLEFIQQIVERMAANSFNLKGWSVVIVSALFALGAADSNEAMVLLAAIPVAAFWLLDAFYQAQERAYRNLYQIAASDTRDDEERSLELDATRYFSLNHWLKAAVSGHLLLFYGALALGIVTVFFGIRGQ